MQQIPDIYWKLTFRSILLTLLAFQLFYLLVLPMSIWVFMPMYLYILFWGSMYLIGFIHLGVAYVRSIFNNL